MRELTIRLSRHLVHEKMMSTVLCLLLAVSSIYAQSSMDFPMGMQDVGMPSLGGCKVGQIFCFKTNRCVNVVDKSCPTVPVCFDNQEVCNIDNQLQCVDIGMCSSVKVKFRVDKAYDEVVGHEHIQETAFKDNVRQKIADKLGRTSTDVWDVQIHAGANSVWIEFKTVLDAYDSLKYIFLQEHEQFLVDQDGSSLTINFSEEAYIAKEYGDEGPGDSWSGSRNMEGNDDYCSSDECIICGPGEIFCMMRQQCIRLDGTCSSDDDYGAGNDNLHGDGNIDSGGDYCPAGECVTCGPGRVFCMMRQQCVKLDGTCPPDDGYDNGSGGDDWNDDRNIGGDSDWCSPGECVTCGPGEVFCLMRQQCVKLDGTCTPDDGNDNGSGDDDWNDDGNMGGDGHWCAPGECVTCGPEEVFCMMRQQCVKLDETCPPDDGYDNGSGGDDWNDDGNMGGEGDWCPPGECVTCKPGEVFCMMRQQCVKLDGTCPPDNGNDNGSGGDDWNDDGNMGGEGDWCPPGECVTCRPGEVFCMMRQQCVKLDGTCPPDNGDDNGSGGDDWNDDGNMGGEGDWCPPGECVTCRPGEVFCMMRQQCVKLDGTCPPDNGDDNGSGGDDWNDDGNMGGEGDWCPPGECVTCRPGEVFCIMKQQCVRLDGKCPPEECEETCLDPFTGESYCTSLGTCSTSSIQVAFRLSGNYESIETLRGSLESAIAFQLHLNVSEINILDISGSLDVKMEINCPSPADLNRVLEDLKALIESGGIVHDDGKDYPTIPASLRIGVSDGVCPASDSAVFDGHCHEACVEGLCDGGKFCCYSTACGSDVCVTPEESARGTCPVIDPTMPVGVCGGELCETDENCSDGKICCASACGGSMCVMPQEETGSGDGSGGENPQPLDPGYQQCPVGQMFCLMSGGCVDIDRRCTETNDNCSVGEVWCEAENMCKIECASHHTDPPTGPPAVSEPDIFFISIKLGMPYDYFMLDGMMDVASSYITKESVRARLSQLEENIREQLLGLLQEISVELNWIAALPTLTGEDGKEVRVWLKITTQEKGSLTVSALQSMLSGLTLTSLSGKVMSFTPDAYNVLDNSTYTFFVPTPLVAEEELQLDIRELIPDTMRDRLPKALRQTFPTQTSLSCDMEQKVFFKQPETNKNVQSITVEGSASIFRLVHRDMGIKRVECAITFKDLQDLGVTSKYQLGLILVPASLVDLAQVESVSLAQTVIELEEDAECQSLPAPLFDIVIPGDSLVNKLSDWPSRMIETGELWVAHELSHSLQSVLIDYIVERKYSLQRSRNALVRISQETRYHGSRLVAKLKLLQDTEESYLSQDGGKTDLLATQDNLKLCIAPDFYGNFDLEIVPLLLDTEFETLLLSVQVNPTNDAPVAKDDIQGIIGDLDIAYPRVPQPGDGEVVPPELSAAQIARAFFSDEKDMNDNFGMALLGYKAPPDGVEGAWEYRMSEEADWLAVPEYTPMAEGISPEIEEPVIFLQEGAKLKFTPNPEFESKTWRRSEAPRIIFLGLDLASMTDPGTEAVVRLHYCETGSKKLCGPGGNSIFSEVIIELPLPRFGCDNVIDSGIEMLNEACPCGMETCPDCMGVDGGDALFDECGICSSLSDALTKDECCIPEHRDKLADPLRQDCERLEEIEQELANKCPEPDTVLNRCGQCVPSGSDLSGLDRCDIPCGSSKCLDCLGVPNGEAKHNPCGVCRNQENFYEDCAVGIGLIHPEFDYIWPRSDIWLAVTDTLSSTALADISCHLNTMDNNQPSEINNNGAELMSDTSYPAFIGASHIRLPAVKITFTVAAEEVANTAGKFDITCSFGEHTVSLSDNEDNIYYTRFRHPVMESISPAEAFRDDVGVVHLTATGVIDTGKLYCVSPCSDFNSYCRRSQDGVAYYAVHGGYVDENTMTCDLSILQKLGKGRTINFNAILGDPENVHMTNLPEPVVFTIKMPAPNLVSAIIDKLGCNKIYVEFDKFVAAPSESPCNDIFIVTGSSLDSGGLSVAIMNSQGFIEASCRKQRLRLDCPDGFLLVEVKEGVVCTVRGRIIQMDFGEDISVLAAGTELSLLDSVVYDINADTSDQRTITYSSGSVNVETPEMIQPVVSIDGPTEIGVQTEYLKAQIQNRGCLKFDVAWSVEAVDTVSPSSELTDTVNALNDRLDSLTEKRWFDLQAAEFVSGEKFQFTLTWAARNYPTITGSVTHNISRDDSKLITAEIRGITGEVDSRKKFMLFSKVNMKKDQLTDTDDPFVYEWTISPAVDVKQLNKQWLSIGAKKLAARQTYTVKFKVSYGVLSAETEARFSTKSNPLIAKINGNREPEITVPVDQDLTLTVEGSEDPDQSTETDQYIWRCETNLNSENPDDDDAFEPCLEEDGSQMAPVERFGESVDLLTAERIFPTSDKVILRERWTLTWIKGDRFATAEKIISYKAVMSVPEIRLKKNEITVGPRTKKIRLYAWCKAETKHVWRSAEGYPLLDVNAVAKTKEIEVTYTTDVDSSKYRRCHLLLDFTKARAKKFIDGQTYMLMVFAYSEYTGNNGETAVAETSASITVITWANPIAGTVEVSPVDSSVVTYEAMKTEFQMILHDWWDPQDDTNLACRYYYRQSGSKYENINTKYEPVGRKTFFLPEGTFEFKATCRNSARLSSSATSDTVITVEPVDMADETSSSAVVQIALLNIQTALQSAVNTMINLMKFVTAVSDSATTEYVTSVQQVISNQMNSVIENIIPDETEDSDPEETMATIQDTTKLVKEHNKPAEIDSSTRSKMILAAMRAARQKTGKSGSSGSRRRRKRETVEYSEEASGMTVEDALILLDMLSVLGADPDLLTEEDADLLVDLIDQVMVGLCQAYDGDGTEPWDAISSLIGVRLARQSVDASLTTEIVSSANYTNPASVIYSSELEAMYGDMWNCSTETEACTDVCLATAQLSMDIITKTASIETVAPVQLSDIILTKLINPETYGEEVVEDLLDPVVITIKTNASDLSDFDLLCMMWVSEDWSESPCTTGIPALSGSSYEVDCICTQLGILGVFQTEKSNTTSSTSTTVSVTVSTPKPSKNLDSDTKYATCRFTIDASYDDELGKSTQTELQYHLKQEIASQTGYDASLIRNFKIEKGSILISFDLYASSVSGSDTLGQMLASIEIMVQSGTLILTNPDGETLTVVTSSFSYDEQTPNVDDGNDNKTDNTGVIVGGILGGLAIIGLFSVLTVLAIKWYQKSQGTSARRNSPLTPTLSPAPAYSKDDTLPIYPSAAPPPYSSLAAPSKEKLYPEVEKWEENEMKGVENPLQKVEQEAKPIREKKPRSSGSASSLELRLRKHLEERQPTPVDT